MGERSLGEGRRPNFFAVNFSFPCLIAFFCDTSELDQSSQGSDDRSSSHSPRRRKQSSIRDLVQDLVVGWLPKTKRMPCVVEFQRRVAFGSGKLLFSVGCNATVVILVAGVFWIAASFTHALSHEKERSVIFLQRTNTGIGCVLSKLYQSQARSYRSGS